MDVEIRTLDGRVWLTAVDRQEVADDPPGTAAVRVNEAIRAGTPIAVHAPVDGEGRGPARSRRVLMVFNPGNVVGVAEEDRRRRTL